LAPIRTINRISSRLTLAVAGAAIALVATASGAAAFSVGAPAGAPARPAGPAGAASAATSPAAALAGFSQPAASRPPASQPPASQAGASLDGSARPFLQASSRHRTPRQKAWRMLRRKGWSPDYQFPYLDKLWERESGWNVHAENPYSGAYGIPQAVPGSKMASAGPNWQTSAKTQIRWGLDYIRGRYNSPRRAWLHEEADGWY
jgi:hypothetical protein